jgi:hypothetical protein
MSFNELNIEELAWSQVRDEVHTKNLALAEAIDDMNTSKLTFYKARYPYGAKIVDKGRFYLPTKTGKLIYVEDITLPNKIKNDLSYSAIPLSLILSKSNEVFVDTGQRIIPLNYFTVGDLFGVFESLNFITDTEKSSALWSVTAGARTVFLLPRISDNIGHNKIRKELGISTKPPKNLFEQFTTFSQITSRYYELNDKNDMWTNELLIFPADLFSASNNIVKFYKFMISICWHQIQLFKDSVDTNLRWSFFSEEMGNRNLKPRPYLVDMIRYLYSVDDGASIAFIPNTEDIALPYSLIEHAYIDLYGLKQYLPTIMRPCKFNETNNPVYCSLSLPTLLESTPYIKSQPSLIEDTREIKKLAHIFNENIFSKGKDKNNHVEYEFFHTEYDMLQELQTSHRLIIEDQRFSWNIESYKNRIPCENSPFFRGCIRIKGV